MNVRDVWYSFKNFDLVVTVKCQLYTNEFCKIKSSFVRFGFSLYYSNMFFEINFH